MSRAGQAIRALDERDLGAAPPVSAKEKPPEIDPLVRRAADGDERALHELGHRILPRVRNAVRYLVRGDEIDDIAQDVLVTVFERLGSYAGSGRFESWIDGVALRVTLGRMRKVRLWQRRSVTIAPDWTPPERPRAELDRYATSRQLVRALDRLNDAQRSALVMHHVFGWTIPEIAAELGSPAETIRTRLRDGMAQLRAQLDVQPGDRHETSKQGENHGPRS